MEAKDNKNNSIEICNDNYKKFVRPDKIYPSHTSHTDGWHLAKKSSSHKEHVISLGNNKFLITLLI